LAFRKNKCKQFGKVIHSSRRLTVREVAEDAGISTTTTKNCHEIFTEIWACIILQPNLCHVCWVKIRNKTAFMSVQSLSIMQMLMKTWVYGYVVETKAQSLQWVTQTQTDMTSSVQCERDADCVVSL
jgi:hypothetical protein